MADAQKRPDTEVGQFLRESERAVVVLRGVVPGFTRWSGVGGILSILVALTIPRMLRLTFLVGAIVVIVVLIAGFATIYMLAGRPLAAKNDPPMSSPYLLLVLTTDRVILLDRALGSQVPTLVESYERRTIGAIRRTSAGFLRPQQLAFNVNGVGRRQFEFPRNEKVAAFMDHLDG